MPRNSLFPVISNGFAAGMVLFFIMSGCSLDPTEPVQADSETVAPTASPLTGPIFKPVDTTVTSQQIQPSDERDPLMERGARFMTIVSENKKRLEANPKDTEALFFLGNANYDINRVKKAQEYYLKYLELDPDHPGVRTDLASTFYRTQDVESALRELNTVLEKVPDHPAALFNLGFILDTEGKDRKRAVEVWEKLILKHPDYKRTGEVRLRIEEIKKSS